jgi:hypothetical protein
MHYAYKWVERPTTERLDFARLMLAGKPANRAALRKVLRAYRCAISAARKAQLARRNNAFEDACSVAASLRAQAHVLLESGARHTRGFSREVWREFSESPAYTDYLKNRPI